MTIQHCHKSITTRSLVLLIVYFLCVVFSGSVWKIHMTKSQNEKQPSPSKGFAGLRAEVSDYMIIKY